MSIEELVLSLNDEQLAALCDALMEQSTELEDYVEFLMDHRGLI